MQSSLNAKVFTRGGDHVLATQLDLHPQAEDTNSTFTKWVASADESPDYIGFVVKSLCKYQSRPES